MQTPGTDVGPVDVITMPESVEVVDSRFSELLSEGLIKGYKIISNNDGHRISVEYVPIYSIDRLKFDWSFNVGESK